MTGSRPLRGGKPDHRSGKPPGGQETVMKGEKQDGSSEWARTTDLGIMSATL